MFWTIVKSVASHIGADYGWQSTKMATTKNHCREQRAKHVALVGLSHGISAATTDTSLKNKIWYVCINMGVHWFLDSHKLPIVLDQAGHLTTAIITAWLLEDN